MTISNVRMKRSLKKYHPITGGTKFHWPDWAWSARIAGAYFAPGESDASLLRRLRKLADQNVSVILADSPWGQQFETWIDDARFAQVRSAIANMVEMAHDLGLKVVLYQTGLELLSPPGHKPAPEYVKWAQVAIDGRPILFNDITNEQQHWLNDGVWDFWLSPCGDESPGSGSFRALSFKRVREMVGTGIDGLWVDQAYLQGSAGHRDDMWPSADPCSATIFTEQTGFAMPAAEDWNDPAFRRWVVWRHWQMAEFLHAEMKAARSVNSQLIFMNENSCVDSGRATYVGTDPASILSIPEMSTGHEIETIADRMDNGGTGMKEATLNDWLAFRTMVAFARGADRGKPSWILTYGYKAWDSEVLAGLVLAEGACFYENKGPQMADTVGSPHRRQLFAWIRQHELALYGGTSMARVALLYSPRNRDLVDTVSGEPYDVQDSVHYAAYRRAANQLYRAHVPFDIVIDTDVDTFTQYAVIVAPQLQLMSDETLHALRAFDGTLVTMGETALYDEWLNPRTSQRLAGKHVIELPQTSRDLAANIDSGWLETDASPAVQIGLRTNVEGFTLVIVNTDRRPSQQFEIGFNMGVTADVVRARLDKLNGRDTNVEFEIVYPGTTIRMAIPSGIETVALVTVQVA